MPIDILSPITGTVWKVEKGAGEHVEAGEAIVILESMKMEIPVEAPRSGQIREVRCKAGESVKEGQILALLD
jgi:acetyl-CoA carboxylase biotin carboxyl carrier protein